MVGSLTAGERARSAMSTIARRAKAGSCVIVLSSARITPFAQLDGVHVLRRSADGEQIGAGRHVAADAEADFDHGSGRRRGPHETRAIERGHDAGAAVVSDHGRDRRVVRDGRRGASRSAKG